MRAGDKRGRSTLDRTRALPGESQAVEFDVGRWRAALPEDAWPRHFPEHGRVWRQDVFAVAHRWREGRATARQLTAAALMWHYGSTSAGRRRTGPYPLEWTQGLAAPISGSSLQMGSTRRAFTEEYKQQAVAFVIEENRSIADVARNIGVHEMTLGKWVKKSREDTQPIRHPDAPLTETELAELHRLRAEAKNDKVTIAELQMQVEFAKKVATWFAKGKQ